METLREAYRYDVSIIIVSFNTRELLRQCLDSALEECDRGNAKVSAEIMVVDNASTDGSAGMVEQDYGARATPVRLLRTEVNLGFGGANNLALERAEGRYIVLLNSDAFFHPGALPLAVEHMDSSPQTGFGGGRQVAQDGSWQPSARRFHSIWIDGLIRTGLSARFPRSRIFGAPDRTWANPDECAHVDWVPGAFMILRRKALAKTGLFDRRFFLYYEETDLCRRVHEAGYTVTYWPDVVVTHLGGESGKQLSALTRSRAASRVELWRMRSTLLYYRKHHGWKAAGALGLEWLLYMVRYWRNRFSREGWRRERAEDARSLARLIVQAWRDTSGGRVSPSQPW